eukprot:TRINITY_DN1448_c0_g2_i2.p1 TRINITY_DN1448_c0_g2~~TRINITY_DN1448_c0_g2_i2.p1  ORF type:complete len:676 (+),score=171.90 TRINITY_DN1448_c0_g2_i2:1015-3042(+)
MRLHRPHPRQHQRRTRCAPRAVHVTRGTLHTSVTSVSVSVPISMCQPLLLYSRHTATPEGARLCRAYRRRVRGAGVPTPAGRGGGARASSPPCGARKRAGGRGAMREKNRSTSSLGSSESQGMRPGLVKRISLADKRKPSVPGDGLGTYADDEEAEEGDEDVPPSPRVNPLEWLYKSTQLLHPQPVFSSDPKEWIDSYSVLKIWYSLMGAHLFYTAVFLPIRVCFDVPVTGAWLAFDIVFDLLALIDIWVKARTAVARSGFYLTTLPEIREEVKWELCFDTLTAFPIDYFLWAALGGADVLYRVNRLLRIGYLHRFFRLFENFNPQFSSNIVRLVKSTFMMMYVAHLLGCGFFLVLRLEGESELPDVYRQRYEDAGLDPPTHMRHPHGGRTPEFTGFVDMLRPGEYSVSRQYIRCFYWAIVSMTGYGNTVPIRTYEAIYTIFVTFIGLAVFVEVIGTVGSLVNSLEATTQAHANKMDTLQDWMKFRRLPNSTQQKVRDYYLYMWHTRKGVEEQTLLADLPRYLHLEVATFINSDIIQKVPLFKDVSREFQNSIVMYLEPSVVMDGAHICKTGDLGAEMFFISSGEVNVVIEMPEGPGKVVATLTDGCFFGEVALIYQTKRTATIVAHTVCELYVLKKVHFEEVLDEFPEYAQLILQKAAERYQAAAPQKKKSNAG